MFAILIPATLSPLIATLFWAERKAKKLGIVPEEREDEEIIGRLLHHLKEYFCQINAFWQAEPRGNVALFWQGGSQNTSTFWDFYYSPLLYL